MAQRQDLQKVRRANLKTILDEIGGHTVLAHRMGLKGPSYISQMAKGHRPITEKNARRIEQAAGQPERWLDEPHSAYVSANGNSTDPTIVSGAVSAVVAAQQELKAEITPAKYALIVELVYEHALFTGAVDAKYAHRLVELTVQP